MTDVGNVNLAARDTFTSLRAYYMLIVQENRVQ